MMAWRKVDAPRTKAEWRDKFIRLNETPPSCRYDGLNNKPVPPLPIKPGDVAKIYMRRNLAEVTWWVPSTSEAYFGKRVLEIIWHCPHCDNPHHLIIPETWIGEGRAEFVEAE